MRLVLPFARHLNPAVCNPLIRHFATDKFQVQGVKINTPHYLAKLEQVPRGTSTYTVIVSQLESLTTIQYTLRVSTHCVTARELDHHTVHTQGKYTLCHS